jgi:hypothetical protein
MLTSAKKNKRSLASPTASNPGPPPTTATLSELLVAPLPSARTLVLVLAAGCCSKREVSSNWACVGVPSSVRREKEISANGWKLKVK